MEMADKSSPSATKTKRITVTVVCPNDGAELKYKIKTNTNLRALKNDVAKRLNVPVGNLRFHFDGTFIRDRDSPEKFGMEDDDRIEVYQHQDGGNGNHRVI